MLRISTLRRGTNLKRRGLSVALDFPNRLFVGSLIAKRKINIRRVASQGQLKLENRKFPYYVVNYKPTVTPEVQEEAKKEGSQAEMNNDEIITPSIPEIADREREQDMVESQWIHLDHAESSFHPEILKSNSGSEENGVGENFFSSNKIFSLQAESDAHNGVTSPSISKIKVGGQNRRYLHTASFSRSDVVSNEVDSGSTTSVHVRYQSFVRYKPNSDSTAFVREEASEQLQAGKKNIVGGENQYSYLDDASFHRSEVLKNHYVVRYKPGSRSNAFVREEESKEVEAEIDTISTSSASSYLDDASPSRPEALKNHFVVRYKPDSRSSAFVREEESKEVEAEKDTISTSSASSYPDDASLSRLEDLKNRYEVRYKPGSESKFFVSKDDSKGFQAEMDTISRSSASSCLDMASPSRPEALKKHFVVRYKPGSGSKVFVRKDDGKWFQAEMDTIPTSSASGIGAGAGGNNILEDESLDVGSSQPEPLKNHYVVRYKPNSGSTAFVREGGDKEGLQAGRSDISGNKNQYTLDVGSSSQSEAPNHYVVRYKPNSGSTAFVREEENKERFQAEMDHINMLTFKFETGIPGKKFNVGKEHQSSRFGKTATSFPPGALEDHYVVRYKPDPGSNIFVREEERKEGNPAEMDIFSTFDIGEKGMFENQWTHLERTASSPRSTTFHHLQITSTSLLSPNLKLFRFYEITPSSPLFLTLLGKNNFSTDTTKSGEISFLPGQWLDTYVPALSDPSLSKPGGFTIVSTPNQLPVVELAVQKANNNPVARWFWNQEVEGKVVKVRVGGKFTFPPPELETVEEKDGDSMEKKSQDTLEGVRDILFLGAGVGVNPLISIVKHLDETGKIYRPESDFDSDSDSDFEECSPTKFDITFLYSHRTPTLEPLRELPASSIPFLPDLLSIFNNRLLSNNPPSSFKFSTAFFSSFFSTFQWGTRTNNIPIRYNTHGRHPSLELFLTSPSASAITSSDLPSLNIDHESAYLKINRRRITKEDVISVLKRITTGKTISSWKKSDKTGKVLVYICGPKAFTDEFVEIVEGYGKEIEGNGVAGSGAGKRVRVLYEKWW